MLHEKSCGAIVFRDELAENGKSQKKVLMIKQLHSNRFSFPKGRVESGESEKETAQREVLEETSVAIRITESFRQTVSYSPRPGVQKQVVYFVASTDTDKVSPQQGEISEVKWVDVEAAPRILSHANDRRVLSMALDYIGDKKAE